MLSWIRRCQLAGTALASVTLAAAFGACGGGDPIKPPKPQIVETNIQLDLPNAANFDVPDPHPDGTHSVREMRLRSKKFLDSQVEIKGFVTWIYDCAAEIRGPDESEKEARKRIEKDPTLCQRPHFFLGDTPETPSERSIWVVDVPRPLRYDERRTMTRSERAQLPKVPKIRTGDEVVVTGNWSLQSPGGFTSSYGLLVYTSLDNLSR